MCQHVDKIEWCRSLRVGCLSTNSHVITNRKLCHKITMVEIDYDSFDQPNLQSFNVTTNWFYWFNN